MVKKAELIFVPLPITGHLLAATELANRLVDQDRRFQTITILMWKLPFAPNVDAYARSLAALQPCIRLVDLPEIEDPPPMDLFFRSSEAYIYRFVEKTVPFVRKTVKDILSSSQSSDSVTVSGLVLDFFCARQIDVGNELNLPSYIFLTCNTGFLGMMKYLPERHRKIASEFDKNSGDEELSIPGFVNPVPTKVLPGGLFNKDSYEAYVKLAERFVDAKGILVNTIAELEPHALDYFAHRQDYPPVYPLGPILNLKDRPNPNLDPTQHEEIMKWLDDQPESSVVFLCFGSMGTLSAPQIKEIARALVELSGSRFLWSIRTNPMEIACHDELLPEGFLEQVAGRGMVCGWAPQVEVLNHKAIGGFVSHCGWNSILESLWYGVPIVTWPMYAEQKLNAFTMVKEVGVAMEMRLDYMSASGEIVMAEEMVRAVKSLMEGDGVVRKKVKEMAETVRKAVMEGGSSVAATKRFIKDMIGKEI